MKSSSVASGILPLCLSFLRDHGSRTIGRIRKFLESRGIPLGMFKFSQFLFIYEWVDIQYVVRLKDR